MMTLNMAKNLGNEYLYIIEILVALLVLMITFVLFILWKRNNTAKNVLLTGLQNSGKTSIFYFVLYKTQRLDFKFQTDDLGLLKIKNSLIRLIDIPVQEKVFSEYWDFYKKDCKGIVFVVDTGSLQADLCDVTKLLYCILTDKIIQSRKTKIVILSKKRFDDNPNTSSEITKKLLEKELDTFMLSNSNYLECMYGKKNKTTLGNKKKQFEFVDCQMPIEFAEVISSHQKVFLDEIIDWLERI